MTMTLSGDGTITGLVAGGLPNATVTADDLAAGAALNSVSDGVFFRNRIINGDMRIDQRNAGAAVTADGAYPVDRFVTSFFTDGAFSAQQDSSAPAGFVNSTKWTTTTADASLSASQLCQFRQAIEGTNVSDLGWGTANAKTVTLSFWVRSSLTGTFAGSLRNGTPNRSYVFTYTISAADTWEYKTVTIAGDTTGTWATTTSVGIYLTFDLGTGSTYQTTAGSWAAGNYWSTSGATSVIGTLNATWYITGVQLEVGSVATPFERRPYGTELALCQRYYEKLGGDGGSGDYAGMAIGYASGTTTGTLFVKLSTPKRTSPTLTTGGSFRLINTTGNVGSFSFAADTYISKEGNGYINLNTFSPSVTSGDTLILTANNDANAFLGFSAEL